MAAFNFSSTEEPVQINVNIHTTNKLEIEMSGPLVNQTITNAIYRKLMNGIIIPAPEFVNYYDIPQGSHLSEEVLAHRIGMIPLICDDNEVDMFSSHRKKCDCIDGCEKCIIRMILDVKSEKKEGDEDVLIMNNEHVFDITSNDIKVVSTQYNIRVFPNIPLMVLRYGESIYAEIIATFNSGIEHAKWQCAVAVSMVPVSIVSLDYSVLDGIIIPDIENLYQRMVESCPLNILKIQKTNSYKQKKLIVDPNKAKQCINCKKCEYTSREIGLVNKKTTKKFCKATDTDAYRLSFESNGVMSTRKILQHSLYYIEQDLRDLRDFLNDAIPYDDDDYVQNNMDIEIDYAAVLCGE